MEILYIGMISFFVFLSLIIIFTMYKLGVFSKKKLSKGKKVVRILISFGVGVVILGIAFLIFLSVIGMFGATTIEALPDTLEAKYSMTGGYEIETIELLDEAGNPAYWVSYPAEKSGPYPVIVWGNGTSAKPGNYIELMEHLSTWGFVVIDAYNEMTGTGEPLIETIQQLEIEHADSDSLLYGLIDFSNLGTSGHSQGSTGAVNAYTNFEAGKVIKTVISISLPKLSLCEDEDKYDTTQLDIPYLLLTGTKDYFISSDKSCLEAYNQMPAGVEAVFLDAKKANHLEVEGDGGKFRGVITAWMLYQLAGDEVAGSLYYGEEAEIFTNDGWTNVYVK